jgi:NADPH:quinone reductase-like Zn-dependent oxidoreductase
VEKVGEGVRSLAVGDRVFAMPRFGGYTDLLVVPEPQVIKMPAAMTFEEGAALPVVYLTAYCMMLYTGTLREGSSVVIHSAAGGVGLAAIQIAKTRGCTIFGIASQAKGDFLRAQGVEHPIATEGWQKAIRDIVGDRGVDLVLDPVGGRSWTDGYELLAPCGRLVAFGFSAAAAGEKRSLIRAATQFMKVKKYSPMDLMDKNRTVTGVNMGHLFDRIDLLRPQFDALVKMYEAGQIKPYVDRTFRFDEAPAAHRYIHDRKAKGKVLLVP